MIGQDYQLTIDTLFNSSIRNNPKQIISYMGKEHVTYEQFRDRVFKLARGLVKLGVRKGDTVAVLDWDSMKYLESYFAVPLAGGILHKVNIRYPPDLINYSMKHASDRFVIISDEFIPTVKSSISFFDFIKGWIVSSPKLEDETALGNIYQYQKIVESGGSVSLPELKETDMATIFYTSGTTGFPKGVSFTHRQIVLHTIVAANAFGDDPINLKSSDVMLPLVPMFHAHQWGMPYIAIMKGMKYVLPGRYDFNEIPKIMEQEKVNFSLMVPSILYMLLNSDNKDLLPKLNLKVVVGGGALSKGLANKAREMGITVSVGYGMSESAPLLTLSTYNMHVKELSAQERSDYDIKTGIPVPFVDLRVVDKQGKDVPWNSTAIGEIIARAPWLTSAYVNDEANTRKLWADGWMHTGDIAVVDEHGYISVVDREKDAVKSGGEFIPTVILEDIISTFPGIGEVAVVGRPDDKWGERPVAFISGLKNIDHEEMTQYLASFISAKKIQKFWLPDEYIPIDSFEKTSTGKIDKKVLREKLKNL